ncbi:MAG: PAS domain-containing protein [Spirochaetia bacterium]|nr:PAS domain-containing protein [Spirochaetia bacterium]
MTGKRLRLLLYPKIALMVFGTLIISIIFIIVLSKNYVMDQSIQNLNETSIIVKNIVQKEGFVISAADSGILHSDLEAITAGSAARITVILPDGVVAADTEEDPAVMDNHRNRPEISRALSGISSSIIRYSDTLKIDMLYYAVPVFDDNNTVISVLRVAMPYNEMRSTYGMITLYILIGSLFFIVLSIFLIIYIDRKIERPLIELSEEAAAYSDLQFENYRNIVSPSIEIQDLAVSLRNMVKLLKTQFSNLQMQKQELQAILDSMDNAVLVLNAHGVIARTNPAALALFKAANETDLMGKYYMQAATSKDLNKVLEKMIRKSDLPVSDVSNKLEMEINDRSYQVYVSVVKPDPDRTLLIVFNDVTKLRHLEQVRKDFVANVSHELKTPITSIKGFTETLLEKDIKPGDAHYKRFLEIINNQTERLQAIITDLLTLSMLEQDEKPTDFQLADLQVIVEDSVKICSDRPVFNNRRIVIEGLEPVTIYCNPLLIEQAVINLVDNALKYSEAESIVSIRVKSTENLIAISVTDKGFGIPDELIPRIFERFFRVDTGRSRARGGTGLGLSIVRHIAKKHNGSVHVESVEGSGSTFTLVLPILSEKE